MAAGAPSRLTNRWGSSTSPRAGGAESTTTRAPKRMQPTPARERWSKGSWRYATARMAATITLTAPSGATTVGVARPNAAKLPISPASWHEDGGVQTPAGSEALEVGLGFGCNNACHANKTDPEERERVRRHSSLRRLVMREFLQREAPVPTRGQCREGAHGNAGRPGRGGGEHIAISAFPTTASVTPSQKAVDSFGASAGIAKEGNSRAAFASSTWRLSVAGAGARAEPLYSRSSAACSCVPRQF